MRSHRSPFPRKIQKSNLLAEMPEPIFGILFFGSLIFGFLHFHENPKMQNSKIQKSIWHLHENVGFLDFAGMVPVGRVVLLAKEHCFALSVKTFEVSKLQGRRGWRTVGFHQARYPKVRLETDMWAHRGGTFCVYICIHMYVCMYAHTHARCIDGAHVVPAPKSHRAPVRIFNRQLQLLQAHKSRNGKALETQRAAQ